MSKTKRLLAVSALTLILSVAMLTGTTLAWFTDEVTNSGNVITTGNLAINAYAYDLDMSNTGSTGFTVDGVNGGQPFYFATDGQNLNTDSSPIITESNWEPGMTSAKLLTVSNAGTVAAKIKLLFDISGDLTPALWFDFVQVKNGDAVGQFEKRDMTDLPALASAREFPLPEPNDNVTFMLIYGMYETANNDFQNKSFAVDVVVLATQYNAESDGFGDSDYDQDAAYPQTVATAEALSEIAANGGHAVLTADIALPEALVINQTAEINLNGKTLTLNNGASAIKAGVGATLKLCGDGIINGYVYADSESGKGGTLIIDAGKNFIVNSASSLGYVIYGGSGSTVEINGGIYNSPAANKGYAVNFLGQSLSLRNLTVNVNSASALNSRGIHSNAKINTFDHITVRARYGNALYIGSNNVSTEISDSTFVTDEVSGDPMNTIVYQAGTLTLTNTLIQRVGYGIYFSPTFGTTEAFGLTTSGCTFEYVGTSSDSCGDIGYKK